MEYSKDDLMAYVDNFDKDKELKEMTKEEVLEWMIEEWKELKDYGTAEGEIVSIILDAHHIWMSLDRKNNLFVHAKLLELVNESGGSKELIDYIERKVNALKKEIT